MYTRATYNNTRAGPSRHSFSLDNVGPNPYFFDYPRQNFGLHSGQSDRTREYNQNRHQSLTDTFPDMSSQIRSYSNQRFGSDNPQNRRYQRGSNHQDRKREHNHYENRERANHNRKNQEPTSPDIRLRADSQNSRKKMTPHSPSMNNNVYICPGCSSPFDCLARCNQYVGNVPLVLNCRHTVCQECIYKSVLKSSIVCPVCRNPSVLSNGCLDNIQEEFSPNFYLLGLILWTKTIGNNVNRMMLVPVEPVHSHKKSVEQIIETASESIEKCCFLSCNRNATLHCVDCNDIYCPDCCSVVHKSAKSLWNHKQTPIRVEKGTVDLEKCSEHNMDVEFFCKTCEIGACCYCFLEKHEGHEKDHLSRLNDVEMARLKSHKDKAAKILKQLIITQKRLKNLNNYSTSVVEKKISNYFLNYHAKLHFLEKNLRKEASSGHKTLGSTKGLEDINTNMNASINTLKNILATCDLVDIKKLNLKEVLNKLGKVINTPCYLINENCKGLDPIEFEVDPQAENFEEFFRIKKNEEFNYSLVTEEDLPEDYERDSLEAQYESDAESFMSTLIKTAKAEETRRPKKKSPPSLKQIIGNHLNIQIDIEKVEVTHIESLECFYVQLKKTQSRFLQMNQDIDNYIKMGAATVDQPQLNELYLALYVVSKKEKVWCRGRVTEIKNGEAEPLYEVFFIDYGSTQTLDINKLRVITPSIASRKAYAIQCELQNPSEVNWSKNAHVHMGKIINGKEVFMSVKSVNSGIHMVDLMVSSSDGGLTSIIDILIHTCHNALGNSSDNDSSMSQKFPYTNSPKIFSNSMKFTRGQEESVIIANVIDPHHIFVHIAAYDESLKKMTSSLKSANKNSQKNACIPIEGSYVVVEHKDPIRGNWHRALVKKTDMNTETVHVMLVDWGLNAVVSWNSVRLLSESFTKLESQAVLVKMVHVEPSEVGQPWSESAKVFLQKFFRMQDVLKMVVHNVDPLEVALFECLGNVDICINAQLVAENYGRSSGTVSQTIEWSRNPAKPPGFSEDDDVVSTMLRKIDEATQKEESEEEDDDKTMIKSRVDVVKYVNPSLIFIKFSLNEKREQDLHKELQVHYSKERKTKDSWNVSENCVVLYHNSYARAKIVAIESDGQYRVNVCDKPAEVVLPAKKIFEYVTYFNKYPSIVYKSHLANIRPAGGDKWSLSSIEALEKVFNRCKDIFGTRVEGDTSGKSMPMQMWYTQEKVKGALEASQIKFISINNLLVRLGFAYKQQPKEGSVTKDVDPNAEPGPSFTSVIENLANKSDSSTEFFSDSTANESKELDSVSSLNLSTMGELISCSEKDDASATSTNWIDMIEKAEKMQQPQKLDSPYRTREAEINDWKPAFPIDKREFYAWITCAENEGYLYLRDESLQSVYQEMESNIKEYFENQPPIQEKHDWQPGQLCTISYKGLWYRGKVYKVNSPDDIVVVMIDFGSDHNLTANDLNRQIMFPSIPAFASKIKLDRVFPKSETWLSSDYETFLDIVTEYAKIVITGPLEAKVPLAEVFTDKGVNVNQLLVKLCHNLTRSEKNDDNSDDDGVVIEEEAIEGIVEEDVASNLLKKSEKLPTPVDTTSFEYTVEELPEKADTEKVLMSILSVLSYNKVVLKLTTEAWRDELFLLSSEIQECVDNLPALTTFEVGMPCVCPYVEDGIWYRAKIYNTDGIDCNYVFVFFVDYGNIESVPIKDIKMMKPEWFNVPVLCHMANLNISLKNESHAKHVQEYIKKLYGKNKLGQIVKRYPLTVDLYDPDDTLCYQSLIKSGLLEVAEK
ncbi:RING finger protein 17 isoform X2 [Leptinotarsa decemlineata]|uniref:RING finger protein 17 isoform X2 n=1 Tax=Leptinotarsa decemlineata TaxID=7539 RepID=UPI003D30D151